MSEASVPGSPLVKRGAFVCPECDRIFTESKALGTHRRSAHGVVGASRSAQRAREQRAPGKPKEEKGPGTVGPTPYMTTDHLEKAPKPSRRSLRLEEMLSPKPLQGEYEFSFATRLDRDQALALGVKLEAILEEMLAVQLTVFISIIS